MTASLPANPDLSLLKKQAKKLLKQYRKNSTDAIDTVESLHPKPAHFTGLRDAQLVVARHYGFIDWSQLCDAVAVAGYAAKSLAEKAKLFIQLACVQYGGDCSLRNYQRAEELLTLYPDIAKFSFYTALVANHQAAVLRFLQSSPQLATSVGGPLNWPVLLYATYSRIPESANSDSTSCSGSNSSSQSSMNIVKLLLDHGADANSHVILNDTYCFTALTGAMGEGEQGVNQPPHQYADELALILLKAGANPNDAQGLYNTMFTDSGDKWLALLISQGLHAGHTVNWADPNGVPDLTTFDYQLASAVDRGYSNRVEILLNAGANPNAVNSYDGKSIHTKALLTGHDAIAVMLVTSGAIPQPLLPEDQFRLACVRESESSIIALLDQHPHLKDDALLLHDAVSHCDIRIFRKLIELGFDVNGQANYGRTVLHHFSLNNDVEQVEYLLSKGARIDVQEDSHSNTPVGFSAYAGASDAMYLLLDRSDNFLDAVCCAYLKRAKFLLNQSPELINEKTSQGNSALHIIGGWLNDEPDYEICKAFVELLLAAGADSNAKNNAGQTPVEFSQACGAEAMADLLSECH
ncbi:MAG: ankyrin repeat protein [Candidatus Endobugula sp.]|jgi:ankyrin repeat protein